MVWDSSRPESHLLHFSGGRPVILRVDGVGEQELRFALRSIDLDRQGDSRADEDTVGSLLGEH